MRILGNRKGMVEVAAMVWLVGIVVGGLVTWLAGPALIKSFGNLANGGDKNQQKIVHKVDKTRTYFELDEASGKYKPAFVDKTSEYSNELAAQEPPETLWEKFWKMGVMSVVIIIVLGYLGILPIIKLWWNKVVRPKLAQAKIALEEKEELNDEARLIVQSVDDGLASMDANIKAAQTLSASTTDATVKATYNTIAASLQDMKADFMAAMSRKQDSTTKLLVSELKND
jgi:hypothetical protein